MTDTPSPPGREGPAYGARPEQSGIPAYGQPPAVPAGTALAPAPVGKIRDTGTCFLLTIVTLGFYTLYWYYKTHEEMRRHSSNGLGGGVALLLAIFLGIVMPFLNSNEVGQLYSRRGQRPPVTAVAGLWVLLLGWFFFVGLIVWFVKTNGALNAYWRSLGAR